MIEYTRRHRGVCSRSSTVVIEDGIIKDVKVVGGCDGNLRGISQLMVGLPAEFVIERFQNTPCMFKTTSCPDQISITLREALELEKQQNAEADANA